jgi:membrane protein implicated in regulation of membrane protease activity
MLLNEGKVDRVARVLLGVALLAVVFVGPKTWIGWFGLVPLVTGLVGFCPLYRLLGLKTTSEKMA